MPKISDEMKNYAFTAFQSVSCALDESGSIAVPVGFNWNGFIKFCNEHKIADIVYYGLNKKNIAVDENVKVIFEDYTLRSIYKEAQRNVEIEELTEDFEKNGVSHMVLKGYVIKELYPEPYLRTMGDIDILVGKDIKKAAEVVKNHGYSFKGEAFLHDIYTKNNLIIELHKSLIDESLDEYDYFGAGFEKAQLCDGYKYRYRFSDEEFYIFLIIHAAKHFRVNGTGIRSVLDVYIYNRCFENKIDRKYINSVLKKLNLLSFEKNIRELAENWFSGTYSGELDAVGEYIVSSGVYGNSDNHELNAFLLNNSKGGKIKYIFRCIFPDKKYMNDRYEKSAKHPFLLPYYYIKRLLSTVIKSRGSIRYRLKGVVESDSSDYERFDKTGLK